MGLLEYVSKRQSTLFSFLLGQLLSIVLTLTATFSSALAQHDVNVPTTQSALNYLLLGLVFGAILLVRKQKVEVAWYKYAVWALLDVEANFLVVKAFQYTSITSATLLDCWSIPCVMLLSWYFIGAKYSKLHVFGVVLCIAGLAILVVYDLHATSSSGDSDDDSDGSDSPRTALGDILVLCGASMYAVSNVVQEALVSSHSSIEVLAMLGLFGSIVSTIQAAVLEHKEIAKLQLHDAKIILFLLGYALCLFAFYTLVPIMLRVSSAAFFNLSLLTSDVWAVILRGTLFHHFVGPLYFVAAVIVTGGLVLYNLAPECKPDTSDGEHGPIASPPSDEVPSSGKFGGASREGSLDLTAEEDRRGETSSERDSLLQKP